MLQATTALWWAWQDPKNNPKPLDHVTFRLAVHPRAVKAAEKVGGVAAQHAGASLGFQCMCAARTHLGWKLSGASS